MHDEVRGAPGSRGRGGYTWDPVPTELGGSGQGPPRAPFTMNVMPGAAAAIL